MKFLSKLSIPYFSALLMLIVFLTIARNTEAQKYPGFKYKVAIIGNPANPDIRYDSKQLSELKLLGFNAIQLNIAWGSRPADEALNLEDILYTGIGDKEKVEKRFKDIKFRAKEAKKYGFRTIFHFGAPKVDSLYKILGKQASIDRGTETNSIQKKEIVQKYKDLLKRLHQEIPEIDDILVYTFDQEAWIANEFGNGPTDRDIPLHERLPAFLTALTETWAKLSPKGLLWWEPWELSAGQIYACMPTLPGHHFGFSIHSNIAEVQVTRPVDVWFKNMVNILSEKNIPVIGEIFMGSGTEEVEPLQHLAAPRLVFEELETMYGLNKLTGIKEYYGLLPDTYDPNLIVAGMKLKTPTITWQQSLLELSKPYGSAAPQISAAWEASAKGLQLFPWDCTWNYRRLPKRGLVFHQFKRAVIAGSVAPSPSWKSTRRSVFMITENEVLDPWFFEDIELRCKASADQLLAAISSYEQAQKNLPDDHERQSYIAAAITDLKKFEQPVRAIQCYCREVNLTFLMRKHVNDGKPIPADLINRFNAMMKIDIENQQKGFVQNTQNNPTAAEMLKEFNTDPQKWVTNNYVYAKATYPYARPSRTTLLAALNAKNPNHEHPRLYARSADFDTIRKKVVSDPQMQSWFEDILKTANKIVNIDTVAYAYESKMYGFTPISRFVPGRVYALSMAYQITLNQKYADRAIKELEAIADWPDWGIRPNFLSVADIMQAFSVGYDWCHAAMTPAQRTVVRNAIVNKGLKRMIDEYNTNPTYIFKNGTGNVFGNNNWNPWCNGAASACALAIGDEEPAVAGEVLERALVIVENFAGTYGPDGASVEGPGYGNGAMSLYIEWIAAMESALGTSYNYFNVPGIPEYVYFTPYLNGPVKALNFHDVWDDAKKYLDVTFFIANKLHKPELGNMRKNDIQSGNTKGGIFDILWYKPDYYGNKTEALPLDKYFGGLVQTGSFRSSFTDPNAIFLAFHAGENDVAHTHLDIGQFNIDALGLNWALDLGTDPITYNGNSGTYKRYEIYRLNPGGHNTLLINPSKFYGQSIPAYNPVIYFKSRTSEGHAIIDMTKAYQTQANSAKRGYALTADRSKIIIQDELDLKQVSDVWWFMHTRATIKISEDGKTAILTQQGKRMRASLVSPAEGKFLSMKAEPLPQTCQNPNQASNPGIQKLTVKIDGVQKTTIMVELIPILQNADLSEPTMPLVPLNKWGETSISTK